MDKRGEISRKSQVTLFVIIAIILVVGIAGFFVLRSVYFPSVPKSIAPVYDAYISCVRGIAEDGASIMGSQAGYIENPDFEPGSQYAPFSNQLGFLGIGVPYWYYISGNGIAKEQIPSKAQMEKQLGDYIESQIVNTCSFSGLEREGYNISAAEEGISSDVKINDDMIEVSLNQRLVISRGGDTYTASSHSAEIQSRLGRFYNLARDIYSYEKSSMFLENYSIDVLYSYAPVSGVELNCSPVIWDPYKVFSTIQNALAANIGVLKFNGNYYDAKRTSSYFISGKDSNVNLQAGESVSFSYSKDWPQRIEVWPTKNNLMIANPVGTQPGLSAMGFCYAPYKFVYDMYFPIMIQIYNSDASEMFQFPVAIVISKNNAREALPSEYISSGDDICDKANSNITVYTYDATLAPVEADIEFKCLASTCTLGRTKINNATGYASLEASVPACTNGQIMANAEGYKEQNYIISTNEEYSADIVLLKEHKVNIEVYVDNQQTNDLSLITISLNKSGNYDLVSSAAYPYNNQMSLSDGDYKFTAKVMSDIALTIPSTKTTQCTKVPQTGIAGFFGFETEKCFDINLPSQQLSTYVRAGGSSIYFISQSELENANVIRFYIKSMKKPSTIEEAQQNYESSELREMRVEIA